MNYESSRFQVGYQAPSKQNQASGNSKVWKGHYAYVCRDTCPTAFLKCLPHFYLHRRHMQGDLRTNHSLKGKCFQISFPFSLPATIPQFIFWTHEGSEEKDFLSLLIMCEALHICRLACVLSCFSHVPLFVTPWTIAYQSPLSMEFSRQEYWSGLPFSSPGGLPDPGIEPVSLTSPALVDRFFTTRFSSVTQSCPTLCNPTDCSTPGLPVHHPLPEFTQTHVHWVGDAIFTTSSTSM